MNFKKKIKIIDKNKLKNTKLNNNFLNVVNIDYDNSLKFEKISNKSNKFIKKSFQTSFDIIKKYKLKKFINGPINKKTFFNNKFQGVTEYISSNFKIKRNAMLIYNENYQFALNNTHAFEKSLKNYNRKLT